MFLKNKIVPGSAAEYTLLKISIGIAVFLLVLDQITKVLVEQKMVLGESIEIINIHGKGYKLITPEAE